MTNDDMSLATFQQTRQRIAAHIRQTPLLSLPVVHSDVPPQLRLKLENLQVAGSFKSRGVFNNLLQLDPQQRQRGVITASGGNHGLALAAAARRLAIPATIYLPETANPHREARIAAWQARVLRYGTAWDDAHTRALEHATEEGLTYIHPFDSPITLAGQGTLGLELLDDVPDLDCVLIAIGGGGLIGGMAAAIKPARPTVRVIGVEPIGAASMLRSIQAGQVSPLATVNTIADTLSPRAPSARTLALAQKYVDEIVLVDDAGMLAAMRWLWLECNQLVEPAGAAVIAALLAGVVDVRPFRHPVALICGGNASVDCIFTAYQSPS